MKTECGTWLDDDRRSFFSNVEAKLSADDPDVGGTFWKYLSELITTIDSLRNENAELRKQA